MTLVEIGRVTRPHGIRGEVRVHLHWPGSDTLESVKSIHLSQRGGEPKEHRVRQARRADKAFLLRLEGIDDRDAAESLRGASVSVPREALPPLGEGEYYLSDLVGAKVLGPDGPVGEVAEVRVHPTVDAVIVRLAGGKLVEQPLSEPWLARVDTEARVIELTSLDGLI